MERTAERQDDAIRQQDLPAELSSLEDMDTTDSPVTPCTSGNVNFPLKAGYDINLVSSLNNTPYDQKMKQIINDNGWTLTTPFTGRLGEPEMQSAEEALKNCLYVVLIITKEDCIKKKNGKYNMIIEMTFQTLDMEGYLQDRLIPILCCDKESLPLRLRSLKGAGIDDVNLEQRLKETIGKMIREQREARSRLVSGASDETDRGQSVAGSYWVNRPELGRGFTTA